MFYLDIWFFLITRLMETWFSIFWLCPNLFNHSSIVQQFISAFFSHNVNNKPHSCIYISRHITDYFLGTNPTGSNGMAIVVNYLLLLLFLIGG